MLITDVIFSLINRRMIQGIDGLKKGRLNLHTNEHLQKLEIIPGYARHQQHAGTHAQLSLPTCSHLKPNSLALF